MSKKNKDYNKNKDFTEKLERKAPRDMKEKFPRETQEVKRSSQEIAAEKDNEHSTKNQDENRVSKSLQPSIKVEEHASKTDSSADSIQKILDHIKDEFGMEIAKLDKKIEDIHNNESEVTEIIRKDFSKEIDNATKCLENLVNNSKYSTIKKINEVIEQTKSESSSLSRNIHNDTKKSQEEVLKGTKFIQKKVDKLDDICEVAETMQGKLTKLDQLEKITSILSEKGVEINREFPPTCEEEEDIINLVRYSKKITEQLGYAARELIRKKEYIGRMKQNIVNEQNITEKKVSDAHKEGINEGKLIVLKALLSKYEDVDTIMESKDSHVHVLWSLMQDLDVTIDGNGEYKKGRVLELSEEEAEKMSGIYKKIDGAGRYSVVKTGLVYTNDIVFKAEFEKIPNEKTNVESENNNSVESVENTEEDTSKIQSEEVKDETVAEEKETVQDQEER